MTSSGESGSESDSDSPSDLGAATGKPSSAAKGGAGTSQPASKRARKGGDDELVQIEEGLVVTRSELLDKMKELKRRFLEASRTGCIGKTPKERTLFELCGLLWGGGGGGGGVPTSPENEGGPAAGPSKLPEEESEEEYWASVPSVLQFYGIELDEEVLRVGTRMVGRSKVEEVKKRFREFQMAEQKMAAERAALKLEVTKLFLDGYLAATK